MSQFGMQTPGGRLRRGASPDVYTALIGMACIALLAACLTMFLYANKKVGKAGSPFALQDTAAGKIELPQ